MVQVADTITLATAATSGSIFNLGAGTDTLNLGNFTNAITVLGAETVNGGTETMTSVWVLA